MTALPAPTWRSACGRASLYVGDALSVLRSLPDGLVQCVVTSPPYWGLRDYGTGEWEGGSETCDHVAPSRQGTNGQRANRAHTQGHVYGEVCGRCGAVRLDAQLGLEPTPDEYMAKMVEVFAEVRRVMRDDGTLWLNLGDSYTSGGRSDYGSISPNTKQASHANIKHTPRSQQPPGLKPKDLCGIPWRLALALQADGWYLRQDIIWHKPNPMPESCTDRCTKSHEYIFLLSKRARYYYDAEAIKEPAVYAGQPRGGSTNRYEQNAAGMDNREYDTRNKRSVWTVNTAPYPDAHFATYPPDLIEPCIMAGAAAKCCAECGTPWEREVEKSRTFESGSGRSGNAIGGKQDPVQGGGETMDIRRGPVVHTVTLGWAPACKCNTTETQASIVLDPFAGSGTTMQVAHKHGCRSIGIELNPEYAELIVKRIDQELRQGRMFA